MKTYWISLYLEISNMDNLKKYGVKAIPVIKSYGGKPVVRGGKLKSFSGEKNNNYSACTSCSFSENKNNTNSYSNSALTTATFQTMANY